MTSIYIHPQLEPTIASLGRHLPHAIILSGRKGSGLNALAEHIAAVHPAQLSRVVPALLTKTSTVPQISVDMMRELYQDVRTKHETGRIIIIEQADKMTESAQNAFLKLLEEPNASTHFILTTVKPDLLLPTIRSRAQLINVPPLTNDQTLQLINDLAVPDAKKRQLLFIAQGLPAELTKLASDDEYFESTSARMQIVKQLLAPTPYERLTAVLALKAERHEVLQLIESVIHVLLARVDANTVARLALLEQAYHRIEAGGNIKLQLARAVLK